MENSKNVIQDIEKIQQCTQSLVEQINKAGVEWKDEKYQQLTEAIQRIAGNTRELIETGEECKRNIQVFESYTQQ